MKKIKLGLLPKVIIAIALGIVCSWFFPEEVTRIFVTINSIFGNFLSFIVPFIILGLVAPGIAELGKGAGKLLVITVALAYGFTVFAGYFSYINCRWAFPMFLVRDPNFTLATISHTTAITPYFTIDMPPVLGVMSALVLAFTLGLGSAMVGAKSLTAGLIDFKNIINLVIQKVLIPLLPLFIFGIFLKLGAEGQVATILKLFIRVIVIIFALHIVWLLIQFGIAGIVAKKNPIKALITMLPAYFTALGTQSSAATIPVTLAQARKNGVDEEVAEFVIPLCATIHLAGSILKIVACAYAIMWMLNIPAGYSLYTGFIFTLGITVVAAPGVPGGAIMAALAVLQSILGFDATLQALMIALYIAMDSFGTACNVTGDGSIALIINQIKG